ncbi:MAG: xylulokinase [Pseudomonadota bacterium]
MGGAGSLTYLGLDLGTSGVKALLINAEQKVVASATAPLDVARPHSGWSEQEPADWISACTRAQQELGTKANLASVAGIGLSGHMHGATFVDSDGSALRPCILWNDTRSHKEAAELDANPFFRTQSGNIVFPGFTAPKAVWVARNEPDIFAKTAKILLPKDYLRFWLTGEYVSEMSDAAGTSWLDTGRRDWSSELLGACGLTRSHMPDLVEGSDVSGHLRADLAEKLGLPPQVPVAGGAGDNAASAIGVGVVRPGEAFLSLGTSGVLFAANEGYAPDPDTALHTFCHAIPGTWHQMGVILAATDALNWYAGWVGSDPAALTNELDDLQAPGRTLFLPYLGGERTPHNDAKVRGALIGLEHATDRSAGTRAVLEGVSFALADSLHAMKGTGTDLSHVLAVGGGAQSRYWLQLIATLMDVPISVPEGSELGAAFGAARLGMMAAGALTEADLTAPPIADQFEPDPSLSAAFSDAHARYKASYIALKDLS